METVLVLRDALFWCALVNFGFLFVWFVFFRLVHERIYRLHTRWFHISREGFDTIHYAGIAFYKILVLVFNAVPWIVLCLIV